jgi:hypothetical protein
MIIYKKMVRKYFILSGVIISTTLLLLSVRFYPRDSPSAENSAGYNWKKNHPEKLFGNTAISESGNPSEPWAIGGMFLIFSPWQVYNK